MSKKKNKSLILYNLFLCRVYLNVRGYAIVVILSVVFYTLFCSIRRRPLTELRQCVLCKLMRMKVCLNERNMWNASIEEKWEKKRTKFIVWHNRHHYIVEPVRSIVCIVWLFTFYSRQCLRTTRQCDYSADQQTFFTYIYLHPKLHIHGVWHMTISKACRNFVREWKIPRIPCCA